MSTPSALQPTPPPAPVTTPNTDPASREPVKKRCANCGKPFLWTTPWKKPERRFCTTRCRVEYGHYGSAYAPLKDKLFREIKGEVRAQLAKELRESNSEFWLKISERTTAAMKAAGFLHRKTIKVTAGRKLTELHQGLREAERRIKELTAFLIGGRDAMVDSYACPTSQGETAALPPSNVEDATTPAASPPKRKTRQPRNQ